MVDNDGLPVVVNVGPEERDGRGEAVEVKDCRAGDREAVKDAVKVPLGEYGGEGEGERVERGGEAVPLELPPTPPPPLLLEEGEGLPEDVAGALPENVPLGVAMDESVSDPVTVPPPPAGEVLKEVLAVPRDADGEELATPEPLPPLTPPDEPDTLGVVDTDTMGDTVLPPDALPPPKPELAVGGRLVGLGVPLPPIPHPVLPVGLSVPGIPLAVIGEMEGEAVPLPLFPPPLLGGEGVPLGVF